MGQQTADHILQTCPTYAAARDNIYLAITHKLGEELLRFTEGSSDNGWFLPRDWVGHLNQDDDEEEEYALRSQRVSLKATKQLLGTTSTKQGKTTVIQICPHPAGIGK